MKLHCQSFFFALRLAAFQASGGADPPVEHLKPSKGSKKLQRTYSFKELTWLAAF